MAAVLFMLTGAGFTVLQPHLAVETRTIATRPAQQRSVVLSDGTKIDLDVATRVRVRMTGVLREVHLEQGRMRVDVAQDAERPFHLVAGDRQVTDLGTDFIAYVENRRLGVQLIDGAVQISVIESEKWAPFGLARERIAHRIADLEPGQAYEEIDKNNARITAFDRTSATGWQRGLIVLDDLTLADAAKLLRRYDLAIDVAPEIAQLRISGVVDARQGDGFVTAVSSIYPQVLVERREDRILLKADRDPVIF